MFNNWFCCCCRIWSDRKKKKNAMQVRSDLAIERERAKEGDNDRTEQVEPLRKKRSKQESNNFVVSFSLAAVVVLLLS